MSDNELVKNSSLYREFQEYVSFYEELKKGYESARTTEDTNHEIFEMDFFEIESNAWIPRFISNMSKQATFSFSDDLLDIAFDSLCEMERELNTLSSVTERHFY